MSEIELTLGLYQHYKGNLYNVMGLCRHSKTMEILVVYQALYGDYRLWVRPLEIFLSSVESEDKKLPRFKFIKKQYEHPPELRRR